MQVGQCSSVHRQPRRIVLLWEVILVIRFFFSLMLELLALREALTM
jgi:hypothetical protein